MSTCDYCLNKKVNIMSTRRTEEKPHTRLLFCGSCSDVYLRILKTWPKEDILRLHEMLERNAKANDESWINEQKSNSKK